MHKLAVSGSDAVRSSGDVSRNRALVTTRVREQPRPPDEPDMLTQGRSIMPSSRYAVQSMDYMRSRSRKGAFAFETTVLERSRLAILPLAPIE